MASCSQTDHARCWHRRRPRINPLSVRRHGAPAIRIVILAVVFLSSIPAASAEQNPPPIPGRATLDLFLNEITNYTARFKQTLYDEYGDTLEESTGTVALTKPGKFRWEYTEPYRQQIISNGKFLWIFDEDLAQVTINQVSVNGDESPLALLVNGANIDSSYEVQALAGDDDLHWLALLPKQADAQYQRVEIGVNDNDVVRMRLHDNLNQTTDVEFFEADKQAATDLQIFEFQIPPDVDVVNGLTQ